MPAKGAIISPPMDRFLAKVEKGKNDDVCWTWIGAKDHSFGYGKFRMNGRSMNAHRASFLLFNGEIPDKLFVCHRCDNPSCVNPKHLFLGTSKDNNQDRSNKGRTQKSPAAESRPRGLTGYASNNERKDRK